MPAKLTDQDPMPFGKHKGLPMEQVPARYLFWLWTEAGLSGDKESLVGEYIRRNLDTLEAEYPDGIWRE